MTDAPGLDFYATGGALRSDSFSGMTPAMQAALANMFQNAPENIRAQLQINSGYRSVALQAQLWAGALKKYGSEAEARKWVAPPGHSQHNAGNAADLKYLSPEAQKWAHENAAAYGLAFPLSNEPWHVEALGARDGMHPSELPDAPAEQSAPVMAQGGVSAMAGGAGADTLAGGSDPLAALEERARAAGLQVAPIQQTYDPQAVLNAGRSLEERAKAAGLTVPALPGVAAPDPASPLYAGAGEAPAPFIDLPDGTRMVYDAARGSYTSAELMAGNLQPGRGMSALAGSANGLTFGWGDEIAAGLGADPMTVTRGQATTIAANRDHPIATTIGQIAGGASAIIPAAVAAPSMAAAAPAARIGAAALGAGVVSAVDGAGNAQPGNRMAAAATSGAIGVGLGGVMAAAAPPIAAGIMSVMKRLKGKDAGIIARALGISPSAAKHVEAALKADDFTAAAAAMKQAGPQSMLADAGPATAGLLDASVQAGGSASRVVRDAVDTRAAGAYGRLTTVMDDLLGSPEGIKGAASDISRRTAVARDSAYKAAYAKPRPMVGPESDAIDAVLARVDDDTLRAAIKEANAAMRDDGAVNMNILAKIGPDGSVTFSQPLNVQQLDYLKRGLGASARKETDPLTGTISDAGRRAKGQAADLRKAIADAVPGYGRAVKLGGDKIAEQEALKTGTKLLAPGTTREDVRIMLDGASLEERQAMAKGFRSSIDEVLANVKAYASSPHVEIKQAQDLVSRLSSTASHEKMTMLLGKTKADDLFKALRTAATQLYLKNATARGSATASRLITDQGIAATVEGGALAALLRGKPVNAGQRLIQFMTNKTPEADAAAKRAIYDQIATALVSKKGPEAEAALAIIKMASSGRVITEAQAGIVAKAASAAGLIPAVQSVSQSLSNMSGGPR